MSVSQEEKKYLIEQLVSLTSSRPLFYLKFCSCEEFAKDVCNGDLYGNTVDYFRNREIESGERGQGDCFELLISLKTENITLVDNETGNVFLTSSEGLLNVQFSQDSVIPIVSFVGIPLSDMKIVDADETHADFIFPFTEEEYKTMKERFGEYCVIIGARELESRIEACCSYCGYDYIFDKVEYCDQNRIDRIQAFNKSAKERFLYKNSDLAYQREYRLALGIEIPEDHFIRIDELSTAKIMKSDGLKNLVFSISYTSSPKIES